LIFSCCILCSRIYSFCLLHCLTPMLPSSSKPLSTMSLALRHVTRSQAKRRIITRIICTRSYSTPKEQPEPTERPSPSRWTPVHKPGENSLYDMALNIIEEDSKRLRTKLEMLPQRTPEREELEVLAEMNRPEVLWAAENGKGTCI
jgi:hypothetical protein